MTPEEIGLVYDQGRDAVIALVLSLYRQLEHLSSRVADLEARISKDSHNSSKPPSSDGPQKPSPKSLRPSTQRRPGGQAGHPGSTLRFSAEPDETQDHVPGHCSACGASLSTEPSSVVERRQVHDLPPLRITVTEHRVHTKLCPCCGLLNRAGFPAGVDAPVQYGPQIKALGVYLLSYQLLPFERTAQCLHDLFGVSLSEGTLSHVHQVCFDRLKAVTQQIKETLIHARLAHFDESGVRVAGKLHWLHVASTALLTYYQIHHKRGREATEEIGILPVFVGRACHDDWQTYLGYPCAHALCNAHHCRELLWLAEEHGFLWAHAMYNLLLQIKKEVDRHQEAGLTRLDPAKIDEFDARYDALIQQGFQTHPLLPRVGKRGPAKKSPGRQLVERLYKYKEYTLAFMKDFTIPFDNNQAERDIRMSKTRLKISGCFRTEQGANIFCRIRGYLSTMIKQGHNALSVLKQLLNGDIVEPALGTT
jgi:transposase